MTTPAAAREVKRVAAARMKSFIFEGVFLVFGLGWVGGLTAREVRLGAWTGWCLLVCGVGGVEAVVEEIYVQKIFRPAARRREGQSSSSVGSRVGADDQHGKRTEREEMQKLEEAGVGSAVGLARSDLKPVGGSWRDRGPRGEGFEFQARQAREHQLKRHVAL